MFIKITVVSLHCMYLPPQVHTVFNRVPKRSTALYTYLHIFAVCDTELFYSVGIYYSEFKVKKNSGSSAAAAERKSGENRTCCGNQLGMILTYAHYSQLLRGVMIIFERLSWQFSVGICKHKLSYKSHDLLQIQCSHWLKLQHSDWRENLIKVM